MDKLANTVIKKVCSEAEQLSVSKDDISKVHAAMQNIHLLSEVWLESYGDQPKKKEQSTTSTVVQPSDLLNNDSKDISVHEDDTSIFDF